MRWTKSREGDGLGQFVPVKGILGNDNPVLVKKLNSSSDISRRRSVCMTVTCGVSPIGLMARAKSSKSLS